MEEYNKLDALGNEIIIGNYYGFSNDSNGITKVTIGQAIKITKKGFISLKRISSKESLYNYPSKDVFKEGNSVVKPIKLFPVNYEKRN